jgi:hypothetical protein
MTILLWVLGTLWLLGLIQGRPGRSKGFLDRSREADEQDRERMLTWASRERDEQDEYWYSGGKSDS